MPDPQGSDVSLDGQPTAYANGTSGNGNIPGEEDILVNLPQGGQQSTHLLLITGSEKPEEFLARGRLTSQQVNDVLLMIADNNAVNKGNTDIMGLIGWKFNASIGVDGQSRREYIQVETASRIAAMRSGAARFADRFRNGPPPAAV